jgi:hypothetical protein
VTCGDSAPCCAARGITENLQYVRGESKKKNITRGITKHPYFAGGKNYLTLILIICV